MKHDLQRAGSNTQGGFANRRWNRFHGVAPRDHNHRHGHQRQCQTANQRAGSWHAKKVQEHCQAEQTEDDRGNRCQIVDRNLNQVGQPVFRRVFLQIERGQHADREGQHQSYYHRDQRAFEGAPDTHLHRVGSIRIAQEIPVESGRELTAQFPHRLLRCGRARVLVGDVYLRHDRQIDRRFLFDYIRIIEDPGADRCPCARREQIGTLLAILDFYAAIDNLPQSHDLQIGLGVGSFKLTRRSTAGHGRKIYLDR